MGKPAAGIQHRLFLLNDTVRIYISEDTMDGLLEYVNKKELHLHLEGSGEFILKEE